MRLALVILESALIMNSRFAWSRFLSVNSHVPFTRSLDGTLASSPLASSAVI